MTSLAAHPRPPPHRRTRAGAFTIIELVIVIVILGLVATIAIPRLSMAAQTTRATAITQSLSAFSRALIQYRDTHGLWPADSPTASAPPEIADLIDVRAWESRIDRLGRWDFEMNDSGVGAAVGIVVDDDSPVARELCEQIDHALDDGDLNTGRFRKIATDRYYLVLQD